MWSGKLYIVNVVYNKDLINNIRTFGMDVLDHAIALVFCVTVLVKR